MASAKQKKRKKKGKKRKAQTIDLTLTIKNVNVQLEAKKRPRRERVKRITSRKRQNLREMRQSLPGAGGPLAFSNPAFYGNVKMLTDSAMNQFQNKRYAIENQLRESVAEQKALLLTGREEAAQRQGDEVAALQNQLADTIKMMTGVTAQLAGQKGHLEGVAQQQEQTAIEEADEGATLSATRQKGDKWLKEQGAALVAQRYEGFTPQAIKSAKFRETKDLMVRALTFRKAEDIEALQRAYGKTRRVTALRAQEAVTPRTEPEPQQEVEVWGSPFEDPEQLSHTM